MCHTSKIEEDMWWTQPVIINSGKLDSIDDQQTFVGNYFKYRFTNVWVTTSSRCRSHRSTTMPANKARKNAGAEGELPWMFCSRVA
jgi:hypothetical protein